MDAMETQVLALDQLIGVQILCPQLLSKALAREGFFI